MHHPVFLAVLAVLANAQTFTTTDVLGNTIVEVLTTNALGNSLTSTLETLAPVAATTQVAAGTTTTTSTPTTTTTTAQQGQQGPVGQPATNSLSPGGPTPYTYTTVVGGVTEVLSDVFTPTNPMTVSTVIGSSGTILDYSSWLAEFGPTSSASAGANGAGSRQFRPGIGFCVVVGFGLGMGLVLQG